MMLRCLTNASFLRASVVVASLSLSQVAQASNSTGGVITRIILTNSGVAVFQVTGTRTTRPACSTQDRWSFDAKSAIGQARLAQILTAYSLQKTIDVYGTGACQAWSDVEEVSWNDIY